MVSGGAVLDEYHSLIYNCDIAAMPPGCSCLVPPVSGYVLSLLLTQARCVIATADRRLRGLAQALGSGRHDPGYVRRLVLAAAKGIVESHSLAGTSLLSCDAAGRREWQLQLCCPVRESDLTAVRTSGLYDESLQSSVRDGTCFAGWDGDRPVALAGVVASRAIPDKVAEISVPGTLKPWRNQGFGRTVLSHVTAVVLAVGRVPLYPVSDANAASLRTARAVGYRPWGWQLTVQTG
jgi:GNAT superfamily N-acetyltransferase